MPDILQGFPFVFYGEVFTAYLTDDKQWYIPLTNVCEALGIDPNGQRQRISRDEAISDRLVNLRLETPYQDTTRVQDVSCLNLRALPYWLGTIEAGRVKAEHRTKVILFKREFAEAAWAVFRSDILPADLRAEMDMHLPPNEREFLEAMAQIREAQKKLDLLTGKLDAELERIGASLDDLTGRLGTIETTLTDKKIVNPAQARLLQDMIAAVAETAHLHSKGKKSKSLCFAEVHDAFKTQFQIHIYSILPEEHLPAAIAYLGARWAFYNPGKNLPDIFKGSHQPSLF